MEHLSHKKKVTIMMAIVMAMFFAAINQTIVSTAMPRIIAILGGMDYYTWVITIYMFTSTIATVLVGKLSDIYGRKPFILTGILLFMLGALLTGFSTTIWHMIAYRGIQGVGAGIIMASAFTAIGDLFSPRERGKWTGLMMSVFGFSSIIGPTLGGWIVDHLAWEWVFWVFLPIGLIAFLMIWFMFPKTDKASSEPIDYWGSLLLSLTIITLLLGFTWGGTKYDWLSPQIIGLFGATVVLLLVLVWVESRVSSPVLPLHLFRNSIITISNVSGFLMNAGMLGALMYLPFFVQGVQGVSPTYSGYVTMPMSLSMIILSSLTGRWMTKSGKYKRYALAGISIMVIGMLIMAFMDSIAMAVVGMIVFGLGLGMGMPVFSITVQNAARPEELGVATASSQLFRNLGGTIGIAIMGSIMTSRLMSKLQSTLAGGGGVDLSSLDPQTAQTLAELHNPELLLDQPKLEQMQAMLPDQAKPVMEFMIGALRDALSSALTSVFLVGAASLFIAFLIVLFLKEIPLRTSNKAEEPKDSAKEPVSSAFPGRPHPKTNH